VLVHFASSAAVLRCFAELRFDRLQVRGAGGEISLTGKLAQQREYFGLLRVALFDSGGLRRIAALPKICCAKVILWSSLGRLLPPWYPA